jgi:hypothetical protein
LRQFERTLWIESGRHERPLTQRAAHADQRCNLLASFNSLGNYGQAQRMGEADE